MCGNKICGNKIKPEVIQVKPKQTKSNILNSCCGRPEDECGWDEDTPWDEQHKNEQHKKRTT